VRRGSRYVEVPAARLLPHLRSICESVGAKGGRCAEGRAGLELVFDVGVPHGRAMVRVYTSLAAGADVARPCGEDAVRIVVCVGTPEGVRALEESQKVLRTAPQGAPDRAGYFLARLTDEIRAAYRRALAVPACPDCGRSMARRYGKHGEFYGCIGYPKCKTTRRI